MSSSTNPDNINPQPTSDGGSVAVGIVLGILAGIFVVLVLLSRYGPASSHEQPSSEQLAEYPWQTSVQEPRRWQPGGLGGWKTQETGVHIKA